MGRPPLPVDAHGKIRLKRDGLSWKAWCNLLRKRLLDRKIGSGLIRSATKAVAVGEKWLEEFRERLDLGNPERYFARHVRAAVAHARQAADRGLAMSELSVGRVDEIVHEINNEYSASTVRTVRAILSGWCGPAVRHDALKVNPVREFRPVESRKRKKPSRSRRGEGNMVRTKADGAKINDVRSVNALRGVPPADRLVDMFTDRRARLAAQRGAEPEELTGWVFPNAPGGLREVGNLRRDWRALRDRHGIGDWFTPRTFRRTVATLVTDALPTREASDLLGHSRV